MAARRGRWDLVRLHQGHRGGDYIDERFAQNWREADDAEVDRGAYHYFSLCTPAGAQARNFLATVPEDADALPPALDLELDDVCSARPDVEALMRALTTYIRIVEAASRSHLVLYVDDEFEERYPVRSTLDQPLWRPSYLRRPGEPWLIWQVGDTAIVDGIDGRVDLDVMRR